VAGLARYNGCPIPDSDKDGVNDEEDKCPNEAGVLANNGCPEIKQEVKQKIEFAAKNIFFQFASDVILKKSYAALNQVVTVLQQNPSLKLSIAAHADNLGTPERNMMWSERRAKAVADYFISKGIAADRITYKGYGDTQPVASNKTAKGRAANRRVEMKVDY
jgi:outer membrane protein OmpA-like peptidoglycan-associated protein